MWTSQRDLAYCAGLFEGEGNINFSLQSHTLKTGIKGRPFRSLKLTIQMTDDYPIELFSYNLGIGKVTGPYAGRTSKCKEYYQFRVTGFQDVQYVVASIWNWLSPKRQEQIVKAMKGYLEWKLINVKRR